MSMPHLGLRSPCLEGSRIELVYRRQLTSRAVVVVQSYHLGNCVPDVPPPLWSLQLEPSITGHMWQMPVNPQEPMSPSQLSRLPVMWQLYPGRR
ncbi:hypothetical protein MC885_012665 [Smutsia gigantea]|nr:hypothetical protein MC885_012665 [Smutsia gigantea]